MSIVKDGTPNFSSESLCKSCKWSVIIRGVTFDEEIISCGMLGNVRVPFKVVECQKYLHRNHPTPMEMEEIAWIFVTDTATRQKIGFIRKKDIAWEAQQKMGNTPWK